MTLGDVIAAFGERLWELVPVRTVSDWQQGVRVRAGRVQGPFTSRNGWFGSGLHLFIPLIDQFHLLDSSIEVGESPTQTCTTADGEDFTFALMIRYRVVDAAKLYRTVCDTGAVALLQAMGAAGELASDMNAEDIAYDLGDKVHAEISGRLEEWGIQLEEVQLSTCVFARTFRLIHDTPRREASTHLEASQ